VRIFGTRFIETKCRPYRIFLLVAAFALLLTACEQTPAVAPLDRQAVVLAFGDSLTYGTGAEKGGSYPARLEALIGRKVINAGISGELSGEGRSRLVELLDRHRPDLMILCHGGNDLLRRTGEENAAANLKAMIAMAKERRIDVVLLGVPRPGLVLSPPDFYQEIAEEFSIPYEGEILPGILGERSLKSDRFHPNAEGYRKLAQAVEALLKKARAL
jgi:lysophospholipase L1-like esterase